MTSRWLSRGALLMLLAVSSRAQADGPSTPPPSSSPPAAQAPEAESFSVEIMVLHATNSDKGIDARIGEMPELSKPPFSSYKSYTLLQKAKQPLEADKPKKLKLPNGRVLKTALLEKLGKGRVKLSASINKPGGKTFLPLLEVKAQAGQAFIVAGQAYKGGILVLVVRVVS